MTLMQRRTCMVLLLLASAFAFPDRLLCQLKKDIVPPPKRGEHMLEIEDEDEEGNVIKKRHNLDYDCPPTLDGKVKNPPTDKNDKDAAHGTTPPTLDWFMGSWKYEDEKGNDVKVTKWCISAAQTGTKENPVFHDYFAFQIQTSSASNAGVEVDKVKAGPGSQT